MRHSVQFTLASFITLFVASNFPAQAQSLPTVAIVPAVAPGPMPPGVMAFCTTGPTTGASSPTCPVIKYNGNTIWALRFIDNRMAMNIAAYDATGKLVRQWEKPGARYNWQITIDEAKQTVSFMGQSGSIVVTWDDIDIPIPPPGALTFANVAAPAFNCVFNTSCQVTVTDSVGNIPVPSVEVSGTARLQAVHHYRRRGAPGRARPPIFTAST